MWIIFLLSAIAIGIIALVLVWIASKIFNRIKIEDAKTKSKLRKIEKGED